MRSTPKSWRGIRIRVDRQAVREIRRLLLQLAERYGEGAYLKRKSAFDLLILRIADQPRMHSSREDLLGNGDERIAWLESWAIVYTVELAEDDRAAEVTIRRVSPWLNSHHGH